MTKIIKSVLVFLKFIIRRVFKLNVWNSSATKWWRGFVIICINSLVRIYAGACGCVWINMWLGEGIYRATFCTFVHCFGLRFWSAFSLTCVLTKNTCSNIYIYIYIYMWPWIFGESCKLWRTCKELWFCWVKVILWICQWL